MEYFKFVRSGKICKFALMKTSRIYHELNLDIVTTESGDVCYVLLPEKMKEADMDWNDMLTPWKAPALTPKESDFKGKAKNERLATVGT